MRRIILKKDVKAADQSTRTENSEQVFISEETDVQQNLTEDKYTDKIVKLIPVESVATFLAVDRLIESTGKPYENLFWIVFVILCIGTPFYMAKITKQKGLPMLKSQLALSILSFIIWAFAIGGPFENLDWYDSFYGAIAIILVTFISPLFIKEG